MTSSLASYPSGMTKDLKLGILGTEPPSIKGMISFDGSSVAIPFPLDSSLGRVGSFGGEGEKMDEVVLERCLVNGSIVILITSGFWIGSAIIEFKGVGDGIDDVGIKNFSFFTRGSSSDTIFSEVFSSELFSTYA
ncbi:hypothetical protein Tco_0895986 [Tanacetum coccineum]|uniref:Uncharacterized protein n=1 Tax=Tanacetum coccineum TaxID=301880 RepID=A0ABQ5CME2_9ASTR